MRIAGGSPFRVGWVTWQLQPPETRVVVAVKGTFRLVADGVCALAETARPVTGDEHWDDDVELSVRYDSDLALAKPAGELFVSGTFRSATPVREALCSVRVGELETRFALVGDRVRDANGAVSEAAPFVAMPLCWERAFGGPGFAANPIGRGMVPDASGSVPLPNIEDPGHLIRAAGDRPVPPPLLPVPRTWPERTRFTGTYDARYLRERWPYYPDDFDYRYYQAARTELRLRAGYWRGDEPIEVRGLHTAPRVARCRLPAVRPRVFLHRDDDSFAEVGTVLDTIVVFADGPEVSCVWRGSAVVRSDKLDEIAHVYVAPEPIGAPRPAEEHRAGLAAWIEKELAEERAMEPVPPPVFGSAPRAASEDAAVETVPTVAELLAEDGEPKLLAALPPEIAAALAAKAAPVIADEGTSKAALAEARALGLAAVADLLEGKGPPLPHLELPPALARPSPSLDRRREVQRRMQHGEPLAGLVLADADLTLLDFSGRDLSRTILRRCDLRQAVFDGACLDGAVLDGARLDGASFRGTSLRGASLNDVSGEPVDFGGADLREAHGENARLPGASFAGAKGARLELPRSVLTGASFAGAELDEASFFASDIERADFSSAVLSNASLQRVKANAATFDRAMLYKVRGSEADLSSASVRWCQATEATFARASMVGARFTESVLTRANFAAARLDGAELLAVQARGANYSEASLVDARLWGADLLGARFEAAVLLRADMRGANLYRAEFWRADVRELAVEGANVEGTKLA